MKVGRVARRVVDTVPTFAAGVMRYIRTGVTGEDGYQAMVRLHAMTGGASNALAHRAVRARRPPRRGSSGEGLLARLDAARIVAELDENGFAVLPQLLDGDICDRLVALAERTPGRYKPPPPGGPAVGLYDRTRVGLETCWIEERGVASDAAVQDIVGDPSVLGLAQAYLRSQPVMSGTAMWWSRPASGDLEASSENAQLFHFDLDRPKWLKFFVYLTDVTQDSGPHVYVRGSHRRRAKPASLLHRGYQRIADEEIGRFYPEADIVEITGPRGTMFVADTIGFHKGKPPLVGERLVFQLEFADSLFGAAYPVIEGLPLLSPRIDDLLQRHPRVLTRWRFTDRGTAP